MNSSPNVPARMITLARRLWRCSEMKAVASLIVGGRRSVGVRGCGRGRGGQNWTFGTASSAGGASKNSRWGKLPILATSTPGKVSILLW